MIKIKLTYCAPSWPILRQTPGGKGIWGEYKFFVNDQCDEYDYWIIYESLSKKESARCVKENTVLITGEPSSVKSYDPKFLSQFGAIFTFRNDINHPHIIKSQPCLPWMIGARYIKETHSWDSYFTKDYDELCQEETHKKTKLLSIILSNKIFTEGHRKRERFVSILKSEFGDDIDIFGFGYNELKDKWDGIAPYKYYLALENSSYSDYWSEKLSDSFLAGAYPIYYGCPNIFDYFSNESLSVIDINNPESSISTLKKIIYSDTYEKSINSISQSRLLILNKYNLFPTLTSIISNIEKTKTKSKKSSIILKPESQKPIVSGIKTLFKKTLGM